MSHSYIIYSNILYIGSILLVIFLRYFINNFRILFFYKMYINMLEKSTIDIVMEEPTMIT